jgi:tetratricopeptide (TPR) repeat protein
MALYRDQLTRNNINAALIPWRNAYTSCTQANQNLYIDGGNIYKFFIKNCNDSLLQAAYVDTLMQLYDARIRACGNQGLVLGRKGLDLLLYRPESPDLAYAALKQSVVLEGNGSTAMVVQSLVQCAIVMNRQLRLDSLAVFQDFSLASGIITWNLRNNLKDTLAYLRADAVMAKAMGDWASCAGLGAVYRNSVPQADIEALERMLGIFELFGCQDQEVFSSAAKRLFELNPGPKSAFALGRIAFIKGDYDQALEKFNTAAVLYQDASDKAMCYVAAGRTEEALGQFEQARMQARKAISVDLRNGKAYILLGDLYIASIVSCKNNVFSGMDIYWAAADQYQAASRVDLSVANEASAKLAQCRMHFPEIKTLFFHNVKNGDAWSIDCWIQEKTIVRARPE